MSVTLQSFESILDTVKRFYDPALPTSYSTRHMEILLNMIGMVIHEQQFSILCTTVSLIEPIYFRDNIIIISRPLLAYYINQPVEAPPMNVKFIKNIDLFDELIPSLVKPDDDDDDDETSIDAVVNKPIETYPLWGVSSNTGGGGIYNDSIKPIHDQGRCQRFEQDMFGKRFSEEENVRFTHIVRLALLVAHWEQHYKRGIPYASHKNFYNIDIGNRRTFNENNKY